jgi:MarR family transcriptional regulator, transcriptional regulator for hemolysin
MPAGPPTAEPIGLQLSRTAKLLSRAFDDALAAQGASLPVWLVLVSVKGRRHAMQRDLADSLGIEGATLTHHLGKMEAAGLVTRRRDPGDRRNQLVELTDDGDAMFARLVASVAAFDRQLRRGLGPRELAGLEATLTRLRENVGAA